MEIPIPESWKRFWEEWDLRSFIILSLTLQTILILFSPLRKRTGSNWLIMPLWSAYLLADWAANFAVGLISNSQGGNSSSNANSVPPPASSDSNNADLLAFWAPFLLVHLGGPDTITAFALEDNELWLRHLLGLVFQSLAAVYIFFQSLPKNKLWVPTLLMFIAGVIKYAERTRSLYLASLNRFRESMLKEPDPGPNYAKLMDEYRSKKDAKLPTRIEKIEEPTRVVKAMNKVKVGKLTDSEIKLYAYKFFTIFKGLIVDLIFSFRERNQSRDFFLERTAEDAFELVEVELNLMYASLFTKFSVVYTGLGYLARFVSFASVVVSLVLFYTESKGPFDSLDVAITYTLLLGAIALDIIAFLMLICSDWLYVRIKKLPEVLEADNTTAETNNQKPQNGSGEEEKKPRVSHFRRLKRFFTRRWSESIFQFNPKSQNGSGEEKEKPRVSYFGRLKRFLTRRWSESISQFNLIYYCLYPRLKVKEKFIGYIGLTAFLDLLTYVKEKPFTNELRDYIFKELKMKSDLADDLETAKEISSARGDWILRIEGGTKFLPYILDVDYDQSLLLWHIATEICYNCDEGSEGKGESPNKHREFSRLLSDYMIYLLVMQPTLMSAVTGIGQIRFRDTCAEAKKFFTGEGRRREPNVCEVMGYFIRSLFRYMYYFLSAMLRFLASIFTPVVYLIVSIFFDFVKLIALAGKWSNVEEMADKACSAAMAFLNRWGANDGKEQGEAEERQRDACERIHRVNTEVDPVSLIKGDGSKSVLFDGCILAKKLQKLDKTKRWELMSKVWVELLSYAAIHCRANAHAQQLSKGGELVTIVWLLMAHFGLGDQFQIGEGHARAKLIVEK